MAINYRVKFVIDHDAQFEECNGEPRPLTPQEYAENSYRACPQHPTAGTKVIDFGPPQVQGCARCGNTKYEDISYDDYLSYYGDPERHVYLGCIVEKQCPCCNTWAVANSVWNIDLMDDDPAFEHLTLDHGYTPDDAIGASIGGHLSEIAREELHESGWA